MTRHAPGVNGWTACGLDLTDAYLDARRVTCRACIRRHVAVARLLTEHGTADPVALRRLAAAAAIAAEHIGASP